MRLLCNCVNKVPCNLKHYLKPSEIRATFCFSQKLEVLSAFSQKLHFRWYLAMMMTNAHLFSCCALSSGSCRYRKFYYYHACSDTVPEHNVHFGHTCVHLSTLRALPFARLEVPAGEADTTEAVATHEGGWFDQEIITTATCKQRL